MEHRYIKKLNMSVSPLGFGVMRLPMNPDGSFPVSVHRLLVAAYEQGINYFDTAYVYLGGHSEELIRDAIVKKYPRESFYIADKMPVWDCRSHNDMERFFNIQLERLGVSYIDFYLLHGMNRVRWADMYKRGALDFLEAKKREGRVRRVGFSFHDDTDTLKTMLDDYDWEFVLLQINYYDWLTRKAKDNYELTEKRGIPCFVMEPVSGGRLANLPAQAEGLLKTKHPENSAASWAIRFAAGLPNVAVTLSGMSSTEQLYDNLKHFNPFEPLSQSELNTLNDVTEILKSMNTIPCSGCLYCADKCPKGIFIPQIFLRYNDYKQYPKPRFDIDYFNTTFFPESHRGDKCIGCNKCVPYCPQKINIPKELRYIHSAAQGLAAGFDISGLDLSSGGQNIVFYGAGSYARNNIYRRLTEGIIPKCFIDQDINKHYKYLGNFEILPLKTALDQYPDCLIYITLGRENLYDATKYLLNCGIPLERIKYADKAEYRKGCNLLGRYIQYRGDHFYVCCSQKYRKTILRKDTVEEDLEEFRVYISGLLNKLRNGQETECDGCYELTEGIWDTEPVLTCVQIASDFDEIRCNFKCDFCADWRFFKRSEKKAKHTVYETLRQLSGSLTPDTEIELAAGEITVSPYKNDVLQFIEDTGTKVQLFTNAAVYDKTIHRLLQKGLISLVVSIDSGTKETFARLKGSDMFDSVVNNLEVYAAVGGFIEIKYIIIEGINDNMEDIRGFADIAVKIRANVIISADSRDLEKRLSPNALSMLISLIRIIRKTGLIIYPFRENFAPEDLLLLEEPLFEDM